MIGTINKSKPNFFANIPHSSMITQTDSTVDNTELLLKSILKKVVSPTDGLQYTLTPYFPRQRNSWSINESWILGNNYTECDIETKISAPYLLEKKLQSKSWSATPITIGGVVDCYNSLEEQHELTRQLLEIFLKYKHPVGIVTKNTLILRDLDIITELNKYGLIKISIPICTLNNELHKAMEPDTDKPRKRMNTVNMLASKGIPVSVITAPIIPGLNNTNLFNIVKIASEYGASSIHPIVSLLKGDEVHKFKIWAKQSFPYRWRKILRNVGKSHCVNSSSSIQISNHRNKIIQDIYNQFHIAFKTYNFKNEQFEYNTSLFNGTTSPQMSLF